MGRGARRRCGPSRHAPSCHQTFVTPAAIGEILLQSEGVDLKRVGASLSASSLLAHTISPFLRMHLCPEEPRAEGGRWIGGVGSYNPRAPPRCAEDGNKGGLMREISEGRPSTKDNEAPRQLKQRLLDECRCMEAVGRHVQPGWGGWGLWAVCVQEVGSITFYLSTT